MSESKAAYRQIVKANTLFGGVQVFNIVISLIRSKLIALLLGPSGMGIAGLFNSSINLISSLTNAGLDVSAVKSISLANQSKNQNEIEAQVSILKRLLWITGIFGTLITMLFSSWLSQITFGNSNYTLAFVWISITVLLKQLTSGQLAILQGFRKLNYLAKANLYGSFLGLLLTTPLYYYYGLKAIVPAIVISTLIGLFFSLFFSSKIKIRKVNFTVSETVVEGRSMLKLGFSLSFIGLLSVLSAYVLQIFISHKGGIVEVGLFSAGFAILNSYVGMIFTAMSTDYFPRLAAISTDNAKVRISANQQALIAVLIMSPIIILFLTLAPFIIRILYSSKFLAIVDLISWGILGMIFKAASWPIGYILIAKGDSKLFIKTSFGFNLFFLINNCIAYYYYGLEGLGITFTLNHCLHFFIIKIITFKKYNFYFDSEFNKLLIISTTVCTLTFVFRFIDLPFLKYSLMILMGLISTLFSLKELDKKINLKEAFANLIKKRND